MSSLIDIKGIGARARELLEATGMTTVADLAAADPAALHQLLQRRNRSTKILKKAPSPATVASWIDGALEVAGTPAIQSQPAPAPSTIDGIDAVGTPETAAGVPPAQDEEPLRLSPDDFAILASSALEVSEFYDELGNRLETGARRRPVQPPPGKPLDTSRVHTFDDLNAGRIEVKPLSRRSAEPEIVPEVITDIDSPPVDLPDLEPGPEAGAEVDPVGIGGPEVVGAAPYAQRKLQRVQGGDGNARPSRLVRRGLENHHPVSTYVWMVIALTSRILVFLLLIATPAAVIAREYYHRDFMWILIPILAALVLFGLLHLIGISKVRCSVCSCPILYSRHCRKNQKAHRFFPLGFVGATALHAVLFRWYRCMYCGTPSQLGQDPYRGNKG